MLGLSLDSLTWTPTLSGFFLKYLFPLFKHLVCAWSLGMLFASAGWLLYSSGVCWFIYFFLFPHVREGFNKLQDHKFHLGGGRKNSNFFVLHGDCIICINIASLADRVIKKWPALLLFGHTPYSWLTLVSFILSFSYLPQSFWFSRFPVFIGHRGELYQEVQCFAYRVTLLKLVNMFLIRFSWRKPGINVLRPACFWQLMQSVKNTCNLSFSIYSSLPCNKVSSLILY